MTKKKDRILVHIVASFIFGVPVGFGIQYVATTSIAGWGPVGIVFDAMMILIAYAISLKF